jgi:hypothetical protein
VKAAAQIWREGGIHIRPKLAAFLGNSSGRHFRYP